MVCGCHKKKHSCRDRVTYPVNFIIARTLYHIFQLVKFVPMKRLTDCPYPGAELKKAWENLLFNQFHDILAGCAIESAYRDAANLFGETMSVTERELNLAMQAIAKKWKPHAGEIPAAQSKNTFWSGNTKNWARPFLCSTRTRFRSGRRFGGARSVPV